MAPLIDTLFLFALPASGKSEIRRYLSHLSDERRAKELHLGKLVQLDDFPYVHLMRRASQELARRGAGPGFFPGDAYPFVDGRDWGTLVLLLNEDYANLTARRKVAPSAAAEWLFERFDRARAAVGAPALFAALPAATRQEVARALEKEVAEQVVNLNAEIPPSLEGCTLLIEAARGGPEGASLPLPEPYGYRYSLSRFSPEILGRASMLYVWVTPEESRRKNHERTNPDDPGSILHHGVPEAVMRGDYGCDDMEWLLAHSGRPDAVKVESGGQAFHIPAARFDNRQDMTTFLRGEPGAWPADKVAALHAGLSDALGRLVRAR